ncbi:MAG: hypothetical protein WD772_04515 [Pseudohongiellaceae bacterium]
MSTRTYSRDSTDDVFVHTAQAAKVSRLITGDQDLLELLQLESLRILNPRAALDEIEESKPG